MTMTREDVERLLAGATPGKRVQFHGSYCKEAEGTPFTDWDTSHEMSVIRPDGSRYRLAHYKHAADAYLSQMAPDLAHALLAALDDLDAVKAERDKWHDLAAANGRAALDELAQVVAAEARAEAAETALAAMTARNEALVGALRGLETANDNLCGARPQKIYDAMIAAGMSDRLTELDAARHEARAALQHKDATHGPE